MKTADEEEPLSTKLVARTARAHMQMTMDEALSRHANKLQAIED